MNIPVVLKQEEEGKLNPLEVQIGAVSTSLDPRGLRHGSSVLIMSHLIQIRDKIAVPAPVSKKMLGRQMSRNMS